MKRYALLSLLAGYVSLSQEIVWFRALMYASASAPRVFAYALGAFLLGLALGSFVAQRVSESYRGPPAKLLGGLFIGSGFVAAFALPSTANAFALLENNAFGYGYLMVAVVAFPSGMLFPLLCHYATTSLEGIGQSLSRLYFANVVGASLGPLFTTFVLMNRLSLSQLSQTIALLAVVTGAMALLVLPLSAGTRWGGVAIAALVAGLIAVAGPAQSRGLLEKLHLKGEAGTAYRAVYETRSGILAIGGPEGDDVAYGGGIWDGSFNIDPVGNANGIQRAYSILGLHPKPRQVLVIGLSTGSWTRVLADSAGVEKITGIEINPAYVEAIRAFTPAPSLLEHPKMTLVIDDGRRWLRRNPTARFDLILMNTTYHWRSHATNLLSTEFFALCKKHLNPGGVMVLNTTGLEEVRYTLSQLFTYQVPVQNFVAVSDAPFAMSAEHTLSALRTLSGQVGQAVENEAAQKVLEKIAQARPTDEGAQYRARKDLRVITDDNMLPEFHFKGPLIEAERSWWPLWKRWSAGVNGAEAR